MAYCVHCTCCIAEETIDLTTASDSDIDRAVAESLRDVPGGGIFGGQVTQEEEQISKFVLFFRDVIGNNQPLYF